ncbi:MAG: polysaccharide biosynthesis/export family protein [Beijerinckiaceae bacterium]
MMKTLYPVRRVAAASLCLLLLAGGAQADYLLGPSDTIRLKVRDWPDLTGEYTVSIDGRIAMPVIGDVTAAGLSASALGSLISDALKRDSDRAEKAVAAVEIIRFRPFFVMGDVQRPGELVYRPGLTVLQAVSMAGGYYRPSSSSLLRTERDIATANGDIENQSLRLAKASARAARLEAALVGQADITFPPELLDRQQEVAVAALMSNERSILMFERRQAQDELQSLENIKALYNREIASLRGQTEALKREQDAVQRQLGELRGLAGRGLALTPNIITLERTLAQTQNEQLSMSTATVRAQQNIELAEQKQRDQTADRRRQHAIALQEARGEIADATARRSTAQDLLEEAFTTERVEGRNPGLEIMQRRVVMLVRKDGNVLRETPADDSVLLQPDDVLKVMPLPPRRVISRTGSASR